MDSTSVESRSISALTALIVALLLLPGVARAESESGCITCHQYPGLALIEPSGLKRILHIDNEVRAGSAHGDVRCIKCHARIDRTPHTGFDEIECTVACHEKDRARIDAIDLSAAGIHKGEQAAIERILHRSACVSCHGIYPHSKDRHVRAIFNLHSAHIYCEVCHLDLERNRDLSYGWSEPELITFSGSPFGKVVGERAGSYLVERVGVYDDSEGAHELVQHAEDLPGVGAYLLSEATLSEGERHAQLEHFHRGIVRKEITVACSECHKPEGRLDFRTLGYSEQRSTALEELNMKGWATKYDTFYFPKLF